MCEYIVNYDHERIGLLEAVLEKFQEHNYFVNCDVKKICVPQFFRKAEPKKEMFGYPIEFDHRLQLGQFSIVMKTFPQKEKEKEKKQPQNNTDVVYIVRVKPEFQINFKDTTINHKFAGKILAQIRDAYVFELNGSNKAIVIIPFDWIECMAPSKVHWQSRGE